MKILWSSWYHLYTMCSKQQVNRSTVYQSIKWLMIRKTSLSRKVSVHFKWFSQAFVFFYVNYFTHHIIITTFKIQFNYKINQFGQTGVELQPAYINESAPFSMLYWKKRTRSERLLWKGKRKQFPLKHWFTFRLKKKHIVWNHILQFDTITFLRNQAWYMAYSDETQSWGWKQ